jgi:hypothetical protein
MRRTLYCLVAFIVLISAANAEDAPPAANQDTGQMQMICPKMKEMRGQEMMQGGPMMGRGMMTGRMMGRGMMMRDVMEIMTDVLSVQEKMVESMKPAERKELQSRISELKGRLKNRMSMQPCTPCPCPMSHCPAMDGGQMQGEGGGVPGKSSPQDGMHTH